MKIILAAALALTLTACASRPERSAAPKRKSAPSKAVAKKPSPPPTTAMKSSLPPSSAAGVQAADKFFEGGDYKSALELYRRALTENTNPKDRLRALSGAARSAQRAGDNSAQDDHVLAAIEALPLDSPERNEILDYQLTRLIKEKRHIPYLTTLQMENTKGNTSALSRWQETTSALLRDHLTDDEKNVVLSGQYPAEWISVIQSEKAQAEMSSLFAQESSFSSNAPLDSRTVGAVLPLTGKHAPIARRTLRGLQLGLGLYGKEPSDFRLVVGDSEGKPEKAREATQGLIQNEGAIAVVGSILSRNAQAVAEAAHEMGTPSVSLSQRQGITQTGPLTFRNTLTSEIQVKTLVKVAMKDKGMQRFAILFPNDPYGVEMANLFWDEVLARGGVIAGAQAYSPNETDFKTSIHKLTGLNDPSARGDEYRLRLRELQAQKKQSSIREKSEDVLPPVTDFDAIFIPDSVKAVGQISAMLAFSGVRNVHLLGPNLWNKPSLARRVNQTFNPLVFVDFPSMDARATESEFVRNFKAHFGETPGQFEMQGYEAGLLLRTLIMSGARDRQALAAALVDTKTFPGALGPIAQVPVREFHRPLVAWTLSQGQVVPLLSQQ